MDNTKLNLEKKQTLQHVALITGGAKRIGAIITQTLHAAGCKVVIHCYKSLTAANILAEKLNQLNPNSAIVVRHDLAQMDHTSIINTTINWAGALTMLVNNASQFMRTNLNNLKPTQHLTMYAINVLAPWQLSLLARPWLKQTRGCIINITDIHSDKPLMGYAEYCQSKAALTMQTKVLAREFAPEIRVNAIAPGAIMWPIRKNSISATIKDKIVQQIPLGRHGDPVHIAQAVLALSENSFITGQILRVDGGRSVV